MHADCMEDKLCFLLLCKWVRHGLAQGDEGVRVTVDGRGRVCPLWWLWLPYCVRDMHVLGQRRHPAGSQPDDPLSVCQHQSELLVWEMHMSLATSCGPSSHTSPASVTVGLGMLEGLSQSKPFKNSLQTCPNLM